MSKTLASSLFNLMINILMLILLLEYVTMTCLKFSFGYNFRLTEKGENNIVQCKLHLFSLDIGILHNHRTIIKAKK